MVRRHPRMRLWCIANWLRIVTIIGHGRMPYFALTDRRHHARALSSPNPSIHLHHGLQPTAYGFASRLGPSSIIPRTTPIPRYPRLSKGRVEYTQLHDLDEAIFGSSC